jgi:IS5 family transposase
VVATAASVADSRILPDLLHGDETRVWGDQAYKGQTRVIRKHAPNALDFTNRRDRFKKRIDELQRAKNRTQSKVRVKVEHVFGGHRSRVRSAS